jgi:hypothetical protein
VKFHPGVWTGVDMNEVRCDQRSDSDLSVSNVDGLIGEESNGGNPAMPARAAWVAR